MKMRRTEEIKVRLFPEELQELNRVVGRTVFSREQFVRQAILGITITEKPPAEYAEIVRELRRIGSNVNQLLVKARVLGFVEVPKLEETLSLIRRMDDTFTRSFAER